MKNRTVQLNPSEGIPKTGHELGSVRRGAKVSERSKDRQALEEIFDEFTRQAEFEDFLQMNHELRGDNGKGEVFERICAIVSKALDREKPL